MEVSRRQFVKATAVSLAMAAAGMGAMGAFGPQGGPAPQGNPLAPPPQAAPAAAAGWACGCGHTGNTGKFCAGCGKPKPAPAAGWSCPCGHTGNTGKFCAECGKPQPAADGRTCPDSLCHRSTSSRPLLDLEYLENAMLKVPDTDTTQRNSRQLLQ